MRKKALITGASRGIGKETARILAGEGYDLYLVCRSSKEEIERLKAELEDTYSVSVQTGLYDVSNYADVENMIKEAGDVHVLINNAAISNVGLLSEMSLEDWKQVMDTNLNALFFTCKSVIGQMVRRQEGKIINVSSVWGNVGASMEVAYSTAKGGVNSFTKALAKELAPSNIQVNAIACGAIDTRMNAQLSNEEKDALCEEIPAGRFGTPDEVGEAVAALLEMPDYLTGQIISLDGGWI
mgnify:CR=1 FL=1